MPASGLKSKGGGTILLVLLLLLGVAGASAFFIHKLITTGGQPAAAARQSAPSQTGENLGPPVVLNSGGASGSSSGTVPQGQFVVPPAQPPVQPSPDGAAATASETYQGSPLPGITANAGEPDAYGGLPADPAPNLLLVPGTIETPPPAAREDAVVRPAFVEDIAVFLAQNYWPKNTHPSARRSGISTASLQWANLRYGTELQGAGWRGGDLGGARRAILGYILNPAVVGRIYGLYSDGFVAALKQEAGKRIVGEGDGKRTLSPDEKKEMFAIYSGFAARIAGALESYASNPSMPAKVQAYAQAEQAVQDANRFYMESMLAHEEAMDGNNRARITASRLRMDKEAATYQKRIRERETAKSVLVSGMSKGDNVQEADTLVYAAFWAYRRGGDSVQALRACAKALGDMSAKLAAASLHIP